MAKYIVGVKEVWEQDYSVEASSKEEAIEKVNAFMENNDANNGVAILEDDVAYSYTLDIDDWRVFEVH